jgi:hypothetical protein
MEVFRQPITDVGTRSNQWPNEAIFVPIFSPFHQPGILFHRSVDIQFVMKSFADLYGTLQIRVKQTKMIRKNTIASVFLY